MRNTARPTAALLTLALAAPALLAAPAAAYVSEGSWITNDLIPFDPFHLDSTTVLFSNHVGGALALGYEFYDGSAHLLAFFYTMDGGWSAGMLINDTGLNSWQSPAGALDDDGTAVAAWVLDPGENGTVGASIYTPGGVWGAPKTLSESIGVAAVHAVVATDHRMMVAWSENASGTYQPRFAVRAAGGAWSAAADIDTATGGSEPNLDAGPSGTIVAAWPAANANGSDIHFSRFTPGSGWSTSVNVTAQPPGIYGYSATVKAAPDGGAFVTWAYSDLYLQNISVRHQTAAGTWDAVERLVANGFSAAPPALVVDSGGNATVAWTDADLNGTYAHAERFEAGAGWGAPTLLGPADPTFSPPLLAVGDDGVVMAVWALADAHDNIAAFARYVPGLGWSFPGAVAGSIAAEGTVVALPGSHFLFVLIYGAGWNALFDRTPPALVVAGPAAGTVFTYPVIDVTGTTEPGARVVVNGVAATVETSGAWTVRVALGAGSNDVRVVATDRAGNSAYSNRTVRFDDPVPALEARIAEAQANLTAAQASLNATNAQLADMQATLNANLAAQAQLQAQISALNQSVTNMRPAAAPASDGLALIIAAVGVALGAGGIAVGMIAARRNRPTPKDPYPDPKDAK